MDIKESINDVKIKEIGEMVQDKINYLENELFREIEINNNLRNELDKKDKIINEMANEIYITAIKDDGTYFSTRQEVIDYFTKKVTKED